MHDPERAVQDGESTGQALPAVRETDDREDHRRIPCDFMRFMRRVRYHRDVRDDAEAFHERVFPRAAHPTVELNAGSIGLRYIRCPVCFTIMNRTNFAVSGVIIDSQFETWDLVRRGRTGENHVIRGPQRLAKGEEKRNWKN